MQKIKARQYGPFVIPRGICKECGDECMICKDGTSSCCNAIVEPIEDGIIVKETSPGYKEGRKQPSRKAMQEILDRQDNKCFWCEREFGSFIISPKGMIHQLSPVWDHYIPFSYTSNSNDSQFVASCRRCNSHKSATVIIDSDSEKELRQILKRRWYHGGWSDVV